MNTRREFVRGAFGWSVAASLATPSDGSAASAARRDPAYTPVIAPNGWTLPFEMDGGVKVFRLTAEEIEREFAPGLVVKCWGYNGTSPGPILEAVEGDRVRILVTNRLPAATSVHWHGILLPNAMDGVAGLTQATIQPGQTMAYEFTLRQHGTQMYHPHADETFQIMLGMMGFFIIHPRRPARRIDRDFAIFLHEWAIPAGTARPDPTVMLDFNYFTFNGRVWPGTEPLLVATGDRVRIRYGNVSMDSHPIHLHGVRFWVTGTDGGPVPRSAWWPETTVDVPVGSTRDIEMVPRIPGDWPLHCHKTHHTMNAMGHELPNMVDVDQQGLAERIRKVQPGYMPMGRTGMAGMHRMKGPPNTPPAMAGKGKYGNVEMGGMFTVFKVREGITDYEADVGPYEPDPTTVPRVIADEPS